MTPLAMVKKALPKPLKVVLGRIYKDLLDLTDGAERRKDMIPPRRMVFVGDGDYKAKGLEFRKLFVEQGGLQPDDKVLDVGSGIGRMAVGLTGYLSPRAEYDGFDIVKEGVDWCRENITSRYPNFRFLHADITNQLYNPQGRYPSSEYKFPYPDNRFDFLFLTSVFTHMFTADVENYLREIARVLKPGKTAFITCFLMNPESEALVRAGKSTQDFSHRLEGCFTTTPSNPETAIAFAEPQMREMLRKAGLEIEEPVRFGSWCGRAAFVSYQDIIIARKA
jgi:ubiquinone/menaquinone biosynthesis C-methylase UbiE